MIKLLFIYLQCLLPLIPLKYYEKTPCDKVYLSVFGFGNKPLLSKVFFIKMEFRILEKNRSGIYIIRNNIDNRVYIGSSKNLYKRYLYHNEDLLRNKHNNIYLQRFYSKYGSDTLFFELMEYCDIDSLFEREQYYLDKYPKDIKFNVCAKAIGGFEKHSTESKLKMSLQRKGVKRLTPHSEAHKKNISNSLKNSETAKEFLKQLQQKRVKTYSFINPSGDIVNVTNIKKFCEDNNLSDSKMIALQKHKRTIHKGWKALNGAIKKIHKLHIPIIKYDLNNNLLEEFSSLQKALDSLKTTNELYLKRCLNGQINSFKGFIWKYKNAKNETITS